MCKVRDLHLESFILPKELAFCCFVLTCAFNGLEQQTNAIGAERVDVMGEAWFLVEVALIMCPSPKSKPLNFECGHLNKVDPGLRWPVFSCWTRRQRPNLPQVWTYIRCCGWLQCLM